MPKEELLKIQWCVLTSSIWMISCECRGQRTVHEQLWSSLSTAHFPVAPEVAPCTDYAPAGCEPFPPEWISSSELLSLGSPPSQKCPQIKTEWTPLCPLSSFVRIKPYLLSPLRMSAKLMWPTLTHDDACYHKAQPQIPPWKAFMQEKVRISHYCYDSTGERRQHVAVTDWTDVHSVGRQARWQMLQCTNSRGYIYTIFESYHHQ